MKAPPAGKKTQTFSTCTLKELCHEDKQKVAKLVKQVVELGQENHRLKEAADKATADAEEKVKQIQECNREAVKENATLKAKLGQAVTVLRMYHHKVRGLDAALRAMQHSAAAAGDAQQQQQQLDDGRGGATVGEQASATSLQEGQPSPGDGGSSQQQQLTPAQNGCCGSAGAALHDDSANTQPAVAVVALDSASCGTDRFSAAATDRSAAARSEQELQLPDGPVPGTPLVLPGQGMGEHQLLQQLACWHVQQGLATPQTAEEAMQNKVLQYDPSIGSQGAFIIQDISQQAPPPAPAVVMAQAGAAYNKVQQPVSVVTRQAGQQKQQLELEEQDLPRPLPLRHKLLDVNRGGAAAGADAGAGGDGLCDASPWESPKCRPLLHTAQAFGNLAAAPVTSNPTMHNANSALSTAAHLGSVCDAPVDGFTVCKCAASGSKSAATSSAAVAGGFSSSIIECVSPVEEVAVEALSVRELSGVVVQRESSASSLHRGAPAATAGVGFGIGQQLPVVGLPGGAVQQHHLQQQSSALSLEQEMSGGSVFGQELLQQTQHVPVLYQQQLGHRYNSMTGDLVSPAAAAPGVGQQAEQQVSEEVQCQVQRVSLQHNWAHEQQGCSSLSSKVQQWHCEAQQQPAADSRVACCSGTTTPGTHVPECAAAYMASSSQLHTWQTDWSGAAAAAAEAAPGGPVASPSAAAPATSGSNTWQNQQLHHTWYQQLQQQGPVSAAAGTMDDAAAAELLDKFDESLVDLLMEVERLEQQQQLCRQQLHQQQHFAEHVQQRDYRQQQQRCIRQGLPVPAWQRQQQQGARRLAKQANGSSDALMMPQQGWGRRQGEDQQLGWVQQHVEQSDLKVAWPEDEDDMVSDILNHLD